MMLLHQTRNSTKCGPGFPAACFSFLLVMPWNALFEHRLKAKKGEPAVAGSP
jgi:hypothetical protein